MALLKTKNTTTNRFLFNFCFVFLLFAILYLLSSPYYVQAAEIPVVTRDSVIAYAKTGVGSPYVWGGDKWDPKNRKWGGADCSGYIIKAWQIPRRAAYTESVGHPYNTYSFYHNKTHWEHISRNNLAKGDILVYRSDSGGHAVIYHKGDKWGSAAVYEARSKSTGIVYGQRHFPSSYKARRRHRLLDNEPGLFATVRKANNQIMEAQPNTAAASTLYFDYFGTKDNLFVQNSDFSYLTQVNAYLYNHRRLLESRSFAINPFRFAQQASPWKKNAYLRLVSGGQKIYAQRLSSDGKYYLAKNSSQYARSNFIDYFRLGKDRLYLTNPSNKTVNASIYLVKNGKVYHRATARIQPTSVFMASLRIRKLRKLPSVYIRINSSLPIYASKKTTTSYFVPAAPQGLRNKIAYLPNFEPKKNILYITNPTNQRATIVAIYANKNRSYFSKRLIIKPRDVISLDYSRQLRLGELFVKIRSSQIILASRRAPGQVYQLAQPQDIAAKTLYFSNFNPASERLYLINPLASAQNAAVTVYSQGNIVYSASHSIGANAQRVIDLRDTDANKHSNTYVKITASF